MCKKTKTRAFAKAQKSRSELLRRIGFANYRDYLSSGLWFEIREKVFAKRGTTCVCCWQPATQVHHSKYTKRNLLGKSIWYLHPVCAICHKNVHRDKSGNFTSLAESKKRLQSLRATALFRIWPKPVNKNRNVFLKEKIRERTLFTMLWLRYRFFS